MSQYVLVHSGIKGMKWGVRRYQNPNGSLTPAGKRRYRQDVSDYNTSKEGKKNPKHADLRKEKKEDKRRMVNEWANKDNRAAKRITDDAGNIANQLNQANDRALRNPKKVKMDLSKMTDQQMRNEINRAILERQYTDMFASETRATKGRRVAGKILSGTASTLAVTGSALSIALAIRELKTK